MSDELEAGVRVRIPWGLDGEVEAEVDHEYGPPGLRHVLLWLDPQFSGNVVSERTTISVPRSAVRIIGPAA